MPEAKRLEPLTEWLAFDLTDGLADGAGTIHLKLRHVDSLEAADEYIRSGMGRPLATAALALSAVVEWDLTRGGKPIPVNDETKVQFLRPLLGQTLKEPEAEAEETEDGKKPKPLVRVLAYEIVEAAEDRKLFLKN